MNFRPGDLVRLGEFNTFSGERFYENYIGKVFQVEDYDLSDNTILVCEEWCKEDDVSVEHDKKQVPFDNRYFDFMGNEISREEYLSLLHDENDDWDDSDEDEIFDDPDDDDDDWVEFNWDDWDGNEYEIYDGTDETSH